MQPAQVGWRLGGAMRLAALLTCGLPMPAADFLVTHPTEPTETVILRLAEKLVTDGRLLPAAQAMCQ